MNGSGQGGTDKSDPATAAELSAEVRRLRAELHRMQVQLVAQAGTAQAQARAEAQLAKLTGELAKTQASSAYKLGQILVEGARRPVRAPVVIPRGLARLLNARRASPKPVPSGSAATLAPDETDDPTLLHIDLSAHMVTEHDRPVIAGVLARGTSRAMAQAAYLSLLRPNDALRVAERTRPDVLLVESAVARWGPWAHLGSYAALERDRLLLRLLDHARAMGVPSVLWLDTPDHENPGLVAMSGRFDLVVRSDRATVDGGPWTAGIPLNEFHPVGLPIPEFDVALPAAGPEVGVRIAAMTLPLRVVEMPDTQLRPERLAHVYRSAVSYVAIPPVGATTSDPDGVWRALACGAQVVAVEPGEARWVGEDFAAHVRTVADHDTARVAIRAAVQQGRRDAGSSRKLLRMLREQRSVQARLATILDLVSRGPFLALAPPRVEPVGAPVDSQWVAVVNESGQSLVTADPCLLRDLAIMAECVDADVAGVGPVTEVTTMLADSILVVRRSALDARAGQVPDQVQLTEWARAGTRLVALAVATSPLGSQVHVR